MADIIQLLPDSIANQIAAGEVIQRPASVVKELVENAIDAGSTSIQILVKDSGKTLIQIIDNGCGMSETDARMSFERHATSKIRKAQDLFSIRTMGFRGEALASIASVSHVELKTRRFEDELGCELHIAGSELLKQESVQCSSGTNFLVKNLFFNIPARRKFLKSNTTELRHIINEFQRIALTNPDVSFKLTHNEQLLFNLNPANRIQRIEQVFRKNIGQQLIKLETDTSIVKINGFIGKPEFAKKNPGEQFFFVNNRYMRHPYFHKAITSAFQNILKPEYWPSYFIFFEVDPESIDINIHPTKTEIKFEDENNIWRILNISVKESLGKFNITPTIDFDAANHVQIPVMNNDTSIRQPEIKVNPEYNPFESSGSKSRTSTPLQKLEKENLQNWDQLYAGFEKSTGSEEIVFPSDLENGQHLSSDNSENLLQFKGRYILTSVKSGLMIIDQRRAHIRILFEKFEQQLINCTGVSQKLLFPSLLELDAEKLVLIKEIASSLTSLGFEFQWMENYMLQILATPSEIGNSGPAKIIDEIIQFYGNVHEDIEYNVNEKIAFSLAKASAIKGGKSLRSEEMKKLIDDLFLCKSPNYLPNGKTIINILSLDQITTLFQ
jgi:DNA mismatch repair protein MutL